MPAAAPIVVLDTNVVLDWLVFRNPGASALDAALRQRRVDWLATETMLAELMHVLRRPELAAWQPDEAAVNDAVGAWCRKVEPAPTLATLRCTDPDDQPFIDLAVAQRAAWLLTRDRAVLRLARRCRDRGVVVAVPERFVVAGTQ